MNNEHVPGMNCEGATWTFSMNSLNGTFSFGIFDASVDCTRIHCIRMQAPALSKPIVRHSKQCRFSAGKFNSAFEILLLNIRFFPTAPRTHFFLFTHTLLVNNVPAVFCSLSLLPNRHLSLLPTFENNYF